MGKSVVRMCWIRLTVQPVKVLPGAYQLHTAVVPDVAALCNAFKAQYSNKLADQGGKTPGVRSGRTPMQGGRTPMPGGRTPAPAGSRGGATPYGMQPGRTPLPGGMTPNPCKTVTGEH